MGIIDASKENITEEIVCTSRNHSPSNLAQKSLITALNNELVQITKTELSHVVMDKDLISAFIEDNDNDSSDGDNDKDCESLGDEIVQQKFPG